MRRKILVFVPCYIPGYKGGGPVQTVRNMVEALGDEFDFRILCEDTDFGDREPYRTIRHGEWNTQGRAQVFYLKAGLRGLIDAYKVLLYERFDVVQLNSFFSFRFSIFPLVLLKLFGAARTVLIGPRGEFSGGALGLKPRKKAVFIGFSKLFGLHKGLRWLASTQDEASDIQAAFPNVEIVVAKDLALIPEEPNFQIRGKGEALRVIFISRISRKKNLDFALKVLERVSVDMHFTIYGPIEDEAYWLACQVAAQRCPPNVTIEYGGSLSPENVSERFAASDVFLFPTLGENFGHVIAESLYAGSPVIVSDQTPWRSLQEIGVGWDITLDSIDQFVEKLEYCASLSSEDYLKWRRTIREWAVGNIADKQTIEDNRKLFRS